MLSLVPPLQGRLEEHVFVSELLRGNPLGDPNERPLLVYLPPGYDDDQDRRYPVIYVIQGYTGQVLMWLYRKPYVPTFLESADRLFAADTPPCLLVLVDAWTAYGGSQFVDSPGTGRYHSYLCDEVVPWVDAHYRTIDDRESRAIAGKSSGGFGAMITPMFRPDLFGALATHAGDALYEYCYLPEFPAAVRALRDFDGDIHAWWDDFRQRERPLPPDDALLTALGISACFSADPDGTPVLPFDAVTGTLRPDVWQRWLDWDPVRMVPRHAEAVRSLRAAWIDAGSRDEFCLDVGAAAFHRALIEAGLPEEQIAFELIDANHGGLAHRYPVAVDWLARRLAR